MVPFVAFCGSRLLSSSASLLVSRVVRSVVAGGRGVAVGCCSGADSLVLASALALPSAPLAVFAVGAPSGSGFCSFSAPLPLLLSAGAAVRWCSGGPSSVPLAARLARRSLACVGFAAGSGPGAGLVCFGLSALSRGSLLACRAAASAGLPVFSFGAQLSLPPLGAGAWVASPGAGVWAGASVWRPVCLF
jgi:hypothetical protein